VGHFKAMEFGYFGFKSQAVYPFPNAFVAALQEKERAELGLGLETERADDFLQESMTY